MELNCGANTNLNTPGYYDYGPGNGDDDGLGSESASPSSSVTPLPSDSETPSETILSSVGAQNNEIGSRPSGPTVDSVPIAVGSVVVVAAVVVMIGVLFLYRRYRVPAPKSSPSASGPSPAGSNSNFKLTTPASGVELPLAVAVVAKQKRDSEPEDLQADKSSPISPANLLDVMIPRQGDDSSGHCVQRSTSSVLPPSRQTAWSTDVTSELEPRSLVEAPPSRDSTLQRDAVHLDCAPPADSPESQAASDAQAAVGLGTSLITPPPTRTIDKVAATGTVTGTGNATNLKGAAGIAMANCQPLPLAVSLDCQCFHYHAVSESVTDDSESGTAVTALANSE